MSHRVDIAGDVRDGLRATPKTLPPKLFYDAEGSSLFEAITELPEYYLTRTERAIFEKDAARILEAAGPVSDVVELGAGTAGKTRVLLMELLRRQDRVAYHPIDASPAALALAEAGIRSALPRAEVKPVVGWYPAVLDELRRITGRKLALFIGSSIGNYEPRAAATFLSEVRAALLPGDAFLLGADMKKDPSVLLPAYDDAAGVTARFNLNVLARINRELGGSFDLGRFRHVAVWNEAESRIEMHLEALERQVARIEALAMEVRFERGERIHTESSYKYTERMIEEMLNGAGFTRGPSFFDARGWFGVHLAFA